MKATVNQVESFRSFAMEKLGEGATDLSIVDLFELWCLEHRDEEHLRQDVLAVQAALADMEAGDTGRSFDEFLNELRTRYNLSD